MDKIKEIDLKQILRDLHKMPDFCKVCSCTSCTRERIGKLRKVVIERLRKVVS